MVQGKFNMNTQTVLVTGGSGFIGGALCRLLVEQGHTVSNVDRVKKEIPGVFLYPFDIDNHQVDGVIKILRPDTIIHLAADHEVGRSASEAAVFYRNNVANTIGLLNSAVEAGVKNFIFSSTSAVYGNSDVFPTPESSAMAPASVYARTKCMTEQMLADYASAYGIKYVTLRYFNAVGAMPDLSHGYTQNPATHLIPTLCRNAASGDVTVVHGADYDTPDGTCVRDYTHVVDVAQAHIDALAYLENGATSGVFNIGANDPKSVLEIIALVERISGNTINYSIGDRRPGDVAKTHADVHLAETMLNWKPQYSIEDAIKHAYQWETRKKRKKDD
jgi:UDP-glucose 4-epimerase